MRKRSSIAKSILAVTSSVAALAVLYAHFETLYLHVEGVPGRKWIMGGQHEFSYTIYDGQLSFHHIFPYRELGHVDTEYAGFRLFRSKMEIMERTEGGWVLMQPIAASPTPAELGSGHPYRCVTTATCPVLFPPVVLLVYPVYMVLRGPILRRRRAKRGLCLECGYDLRGSESGVCSECGAAAHEGEHAASK